MPNIPPMPPLPPMPPMPPIPDVPPVATAILQQTIDWADVIIRQDVNLHVIGSITLDSISGGRIVFQGPIDLNGDIRSLNVYDGIGWAVSATQL